VRKRPDPSQLWRGKGYCRSLPAAYLAAAENTSALQPTFSAAKFKATAAGLHAALWRSRNPKELERLVRSTSCIPVPIIFLQR
jgi:hypothetical protein